MGTHSPQGRRGARAGGENVRLMSACIAVPPQLMYRKGWALLGYLAVEPEHRHSRLALAMLLWPQLGEMQALTNLRQVLCNRNRYCGEVLGPGVLCVERNGVALRRKGQPILDIDRLATEPGEALAVLGGRCVFLAGMDDVAGVDFRTWLEGARLALEDELMAVAEQQCDERLATGTWGAALHLAHVLLQRDAWNEAHARRLMRAYAGQGMKTAAINTYARLQQALHCELGVDTQAETRVLLAGICEGMAALPGQAGVRRERETSPAHAYARGAMAV